jgi:hypothetical protein
MVFQNCVSSIRSTSSIKLLVGGVLLILLSFALQHTMTHANTVYPGNVVSKAPVTPTVSKSTPTTSNGNTVSQVSSQRDVEAAAILARLLGANGLPETYPKRVTFTNENAFNAGTNGKNIVFTVKLWDALKTEDERAFVLSHELAHIATKGDGHGAKYAEFYLKLVKQFIGSFQAAKLRDAFDNQRVEYGGGPVRSTRQVAAASRRRSVEQAPQVLAPLAGAVALCDLCSGGGGRRVGGSGWWGVVSGGAR